MSPEWLPETALVLLGILACAVALSLLFAQQRGQALRVGTIGLAFIALAVAFGTSQKLHPALQRGVKQGRPLTPIRQASATDPDTADNESGTLPSLTLRLGDVALRVAASNRYVLSVDGNEFLDLDADSAGLMVTCDTAESHGWIATHIGRNVFSGYSLVGIRPSRPDDHTLLVKEQDDEILRILYADPRTIEIAGRFYVSKTVEPIVISAAKGVHWKGGAVPPGLTIDLRPQGKGAIDFERSGLIQVRPK